MLMLSDYTQTKMKSWLKMGIGTGIGQLNRTKTWILFKKVCFALKIGRRLIGFKSKLLSTRGRVILLNSIISSYVLTWDCLQMFGWELTNLEKDLFDLDMTIGIKKIYLIWIFQKNAPYWRYNKHYIEVNEH